MVAGSGKWVELGALIVRCAGPNLEKLQAGINAGIAAENARSGPTIPGTGPVRRARAGRSEPIWFKPHETHVRLASERSSHWHPVTLIL